MVSNSAKLDFRTKQHTESGVSTSDGSRDMARTRSWRKKKKKKEEKKKELMESQKASPTGIANLLATPFNKISNNHQRRERRELEESEAVDIMCVERA